MTSRDPLLVVLDTNVLVSDLTLEGPRIEALFQGIEYLSDASVAIPEVVFDEMVQKYHERLAKLFDQSKQVSLELARLAGGWIEVPILEADLTEIAQLYRDQTRRDLTLRGVQFLPYPDVSHVDVARRAYEKRRPFSQSGTGYRDYLIWLAVLDVCASLDVPVAFVTENSRDFGKGLLHSDLTADLEARGLRNRLLYYDSFDTFLAERIYPVVEDITALESEVGEGTLCGMSLRPWLTQTVPTEIPAGKLMDLTPTFDGAASVRADSVLSIGEFYDVVVHRFHEDAVHLYAFVPVTLRLTATFFVDDPAIVGQVPIIMEKSEDVSCVLELEIFATPSERKLSTPYVHTLEPT